MLCEHHIGICVTPALYSSYPMRSCTSSFSIERSTSAHALPVPSTASHHILHLLFTLTKELYRVDGHDLATQILQLIITDVGQAWLSVYEARMEVVKGLSDQGERVCDEKKMMWITMSSVRPSRGLCHVGSMSCHVIDLVVV